MSVTLQREINILSERTSNRGIKSSALTKILKESQNPSLTSGELSNLYLSISTHILSTIVDPIEKCRELSVMIMKRLLHLISFASRVDTKIMLVGLMPVLVQQLGQIVVVEPAEEVRLLMVETLVILITNSKQNFEPFVEDCTRIVQRTFQDPFPDIKKQSCVVAQMLCKETPRALGLQGGVICKSLLSLLNHRHSHVRSICLDALWMCLIVDASEIEDCIQALVPIMNDKSAAVREKLYILALELLTKLMDRHSIGV
jgi:dynein assembly factor 5